MTLVAVTAALSTAAALSAAAALTADPAGPGAATTDPTTTDRVTATVYVTPIDVEVEVSQTTVQQGRPTSVRSVVTNHGPEPLTEVTITLHTPQQVTVRHGSTRSYDVLEPGASLRDRWQICATAPGNHLVLAEVTGQIAAGQRDVQAGDDAQIVVVARNRADCPASFADDGS